MRWVFALFGAAVFGLAGFFVLFGAAINRGFSDREDALFTFFGIMTLAYPVAYLLLCRGRGFKFTLSLGIAAPALVFAGLYVTTLVEKWQRASQSDQMAATLQIAYVGDEPVYSREGALEAVRLRYRYQISEGASAAVWVHTDVDGEDFCWVRSEQPDVPTGAVGSVLVVKNQVFTPVGEPSKSVVQPYPAVEASKAGEYVGEITLVPYGCDTNQQERVAALPADARRYPILGSGREHVQFAVRFQAHARRGLGSAEKSLMIVTQQAYDLPALLAGNHCEAYFICRALR